MAKTPTQRTRDLRERRKDLGIRRWELWVTDRERAIVKPIVEDKLKELRKKDNNKE